MQVIPPGVDITTGTHIFETPEELIINSQIYDKVSLVPKPFHFWNTNYTYSIMSMLKYQKHRFDLPATHITKEDGYASYLQDNKNPNIFYFISMAPNNQINQYISKIEKIEHTYKTIRVQTGFWSGNSPYNYYYDYYNYKFLGQTDDYIILWSQGNGDNGSGTAFKRKGADIIRLHKETFAASYVHMGGAIEMFVQPIKIIDNELWIHLRWGGNPYIGVYNVLSNTLRWVWTDTSGTYANANCPGLSNLVLFQNAYYSFTNNATHNGYQFQKFEIDFVNETVIRTLIPCDNHSRFVYHKWGKARGSGGWMIFTLKNIDDKYIAVTGHNDLNGLLHHDNYLNGQAWNTFSNQGWHRHITYKLVETKFIPVDVIDFGNDTLFLYDVLYYDQYTPIFFSNVGFMFYRFDVQTETYTKCFTQSGDFYTLGFDDYNRFYALNSADKCFLYTNITAVHLVAQFEQTSYQYTGTDILTNVFVHAKNFINEQIVTTVKIVLTGPCIFSDGSKEKIISTMPWSDVILPVTIVDAGKIDIHASQV